MSLETAMNFVSKIASDEALQDQVDKAIDGKSEQAAAEAFSALGKTHGFIFTADDALAIRSRAAQFHAQRAASSEMSAAELDRVAGGAFKPIAKKTSKAPAVPMSGLIYGWTPPRNP